MFVVDLVVTIDPLELTRVMPACWSVTVCAHAETGRAKTKNAVARAVSQARIGSTYLSIPRAMWKNRPREEGAPNERERMTRDGFGFVLAVTK
jgi:hypothetical protein